MFLAMSSATLLVYNMTFKTLGDLCTSAMEDDDRRCTTMPTEWAPAHV